MEVTEPTLEDGEVKNDEMEVDEQEVISKEDAQKFSIESIHLKYIHSALLHIYTLDDVFISIYIVHNGTYSIHDNHFVLYN